MRSVEMQRGHAEHLVGQVEQLIDENGLTFAQVTCIAVTIGPGNFAGLRVGVSAAKGFALASNADLVGINTFDAFRSGLKGDAGSKATLVLDGRRGEVFYQTGDGTVGRIALDEMTAETLGLIDTEA